MTILIKETKNGYQAITDKLIRCSKEHAEKMYNIAKEKHQRDYEKFLKKQARKEMGK